MELEKSNVNFGMAFISPKAKDMPYFKKYLSQVTGKIDTKALGDFVIKQSNNQKVDMTFKHTSNGDVFEVFSNVNPKKLVKIPCEGTNAGQNKKSFLQQIKEFFILKNKKYEYDPVGSMDNLPKEIKQAGEVANKMEKELS